MGKTISEDNWKNRVAAEIAGVEQPSPDMIAELEKQMVTLYKGYEYGIGEKHKEYNITAYIIKQLLDTSTARMSYDQYNELIKKARDKPEIVDALKESYEPSMMGGRRSRKSKKTRKARKARKARNAINKRRSQRNRK